jgi:hypothetical protein
MGKIWRGIGRVIFWSYERGTVPYDIAVITIVLFVLFSPRFIHFNDQPRVGPPPTEAMIQLKSMAAGQIATYRVDARLLATPIRTPELEHDLHQTVQKNIADFSNGHFEILQIDPVRGADGTVTYYDVSVKP